MDASINLQESKLISITSQLIEHSQFISCNIKSILDPKEISITNSCNNIDLKLELSPNNGVKSQ